MSFICENCEPIEEQLQIINEIESLLKSSKNNSSSSFPSYLINNTQNLSIELKNYKIIQNSKNKNKNQLIYETFQSLTNIESKCSIFLNNLDEILFVLDDITKSHTEITSRTNVLMMNCESLLEQQVRYSFFISSSFR